MIRLRRAGAQTLCDPLTWVKVHGVKEFDERIKEYGT